MAEALYRKYRPQVFDDVIGQEHIERTLRNAIENDKVSHAYLFCGPRGTGKTTTARLLAKALLCDDAPTPTPCGACRECTEIAEGVHPDVYELDAASRTGVDNVREEIIGRVSFAPTRGKRKVYIIDEVHMLSMPAFNALLKTLEEPPAHVVFILCTTESHAVPETIQSRCQRFDFRRIAVEEIVSRLGAICTAEGVAFDGQALELIAQRAEGGMRNALTSLEQLISFGEGKVTEQAAEDLLGSLDADDLATVMRAIAQRDAAACFDWTARYVESGADVAQFVRDLAEHVRNLYVLTLAGAEAPLEVNEVQRQALVRELPHFSADRLARLLGLLGDLILEMKTSVNPRLSFEIALTRMIRPASDLTLESLAERIEALEAGAAARPARIVPASALAGEGQAAPSPAAMPAPAAQGMPVAQPGPQAAAAAAAAARGDQAHAAQGGQAGSARQAAAGPSGAASAGAAQGGAPAGLSAEGAQAAARSRAEAAATGARAASAHAASAAETTPAAGARAAVPHPEAASGAAPSPAGSTASEPRAAAASGSANAAGAQPAASLRVSPDAVPADAAYLTGNAALQRMWRSVTARLRKEEPAYGVMFATARVSADPARRMVLIGMPADNPVAFSFSQKPKVQEVLARLLAEEAGHPVAFACVSGAPAASPASAAAAQPGADAAPAPEERSSAVPSAARQAAEAARQAVRERAARQAAEAASEGGPARAARGTAASAPGFEPSASPAPGNAPAQESGHAPAGSAGEPEASAEDIAALLSQSMGTDIVFEEIE